MSLITFLPNSLKSVFISEHDVFRGESLAEEAVELRADSFCVFL